GELAGAGQARAVLQAEVQRGAQYRRPAVGLQLHHVLRRVRTRRSEGQHERLVYYPYRRLSERTDGVRLAGPVRVPSRLARCFAYGRPPGVDDLAVHNAAGRPGTRGAATDGREDLVCY